MLRSFLSEAQVLSKHVQVLFLRFASWTFAQNFYLKRTSVRSFLSAWLYLRIRPSRIFSFIEAVPNLPLTIWVRIWSSRVTPCLQRRMLISFVWWWHVLSLISREARVVSLSNTSSRVCQLWCSCHTELLWPPCRFDSLAGCCCCSPIRLNDWFKVFEVRGLWKRSAFMCKLSSVRSPTSWYSVLFTLRRKPCLENASFPFWLRYFTLAHVVAASSMSSVNAIVVGVGVSRGHDTTRGATGWKVEEKFPFCTPTLT